MNNLRILVIVIAAFWICGSNQAQGTLPTESQTGASEPRDANATHSANSANSASDPGDASDASEALPAAFSGTAPYQITDFVKTTEILGPLTPIALSPFFGITVLSGLANFGGETSWGQLFASNQLLASNPVLNHPATFWIFLGLTVITSLPRLTKVTKPVAQALDWIESYSGLLTSLTIFVISMSTMNRDTDVALTVQQAGVLSLTVNAFLLVAATVNFIVVKSVRFFFELLIWISPIPLIDAFFEALNKSCCFLLLLVYAYSPTFALFLNLSVFVACVFIFNWAQRRLNYHWYMWLEPVIQWIFPSYRAFDGKNLWVYCEQDFAPFRRYDRLHLYHWEDKWVLMRYDFAWRKCFREFNHDDLPLIEPGGLKNCIVLQQQEPVRFSFHRGFNKHMDAISHGLKISTKERIEYRNQKAIAAADATAQ